MGCAHIEHLPEASAHRTGVWITNRKQRRTQLAALAELDVDWTR
ncbi:hypothetical protein [Streptomyces sp. AP-93]|nr:hypothetical protein [Streptomyces sp. AP-93]